MLATFLGLIDIFTDALGQFIIHNGIFAPILLLMIEESGIPLPIPGDIYVAYMGFLVSKGAIPYWLAMLLLLVAVMVGASILFYLSSRYGHIIVMRFGKYIHLDEKKLLLVEEKFKKYGVLVIIFGRHIPGFRIPITVFSGMSGISYRSFIISTFVSVIFWIAFYLYVGEHVGPRIFDLLQTHRKFYLLFLIPFLIFAGGIVYVHLHSKKEKRRKRVEDN